VFTSNLFAVIEREPHEMTSEDPRATRSHNSDLKLCERTVRSILDLAFT
jgi:hypothetical protein